MSRSNYDSQARHDIAITLYKRGKTLEYCAKICGYGKDYIRQLLTKEGLWETLPKTAERKERKVLEMIQNGYNEAEIAEAVGYKGTSAIFRIAKENGLKVITSKKQDKEKRNKRIVELKIKGYTREQIAEMLGVSAMMVTVYAKGINPQKFSPEEQSRLAKEQHQKTLRERENKARQQIAQKGYEYVGGYVDTDSFVTIRCPECGAVFERSMVSIRHNQSIVCPGCAERAKEEKERQKAEAREQAQKEKEAKRQERERLEQERKDQKYHPCPVCGEITNRPKYCSDACAKKVANTKHETRRRIKIKSVLVDGDITVERLYERDHGICWICGERCDWNDKETRNNGTIVCGNNYPSIDHVISLAKGGEHKWSNVALAHRLCNSIRGAG